MKIVIVGGGISGLSLAYLLLEQEPSLDVEIYESLDGAGGKIRTEKVDGYLCESGVNGFLDNRPYTLELASQMNISPLRSGDDARIRYIYSNNRLNVLPEKPFSFFKSDLLTLKGRLRVLYEPFAPKGKDDETLEAFAVRRLGREAYEKLIDPMASGIYAGDGSRLSLRSCFPRIYELESEHGSLIRAMLRLKKSRKNGREMSVGPGGVLTSFYDGMQTLVDTMKERLGNRLRVGAHVASVDRKDGAYNIFFKDGAKIEADILVLATPAYASSKILREVNAQLSDVLNKIPYPSVTVVCLGFREEKVKHRLNGFGFLVPCCEKKKILGTLWDSSIFPNRAPSGHVLLRTMVGGARASRIAAQDDEKILNDVMDELQAIMGITAAPDFVRIYRHEQAIPQYNLGHQLVLDEINSVMNRCRGIYLTGNAYRGIGLNDCIENSYKLRDKILGL